jgi:hypothetical protein
MEIQEREDLKNPEFGANLRAVIDENLESMMNDSDRAKNIHQKMREESNLA